MQLLICISACSSDKTCPGCSGNGTFVYGDKYITCQFCNGSGKISSDRYELITSTPEVMNLSRRKIIARYARVQENFMLQTLL